MNKKVTFTKLYNSQQYAMLWQDEKSFKIIKNTLRDMTDNRITLSNVEAYNKTYQLNQKGLKEYIETKLSKKLFVELFSQFITI